MWEQKFLSEKLALIHEFSGLKSKLLTLQFIWCHFEAILDGYRKYIICCYTNICMSFHSINFVLHLFLILFFFKISIQYAHILLWILTKTYTNRKCGFSLLPLLACYINDFWKCTRVWMEACVLPTILSPSLSWAEVPCLHEVHLFLANSS